MKRFFISVLSVATVFMQAAAAVQSPVTGTVTDEAGAPVAYATVIAMKNDVQAAGTATDDKGAFRLSIADGEYKLTIEYLGYESVERDITVKGATDTGKTTLKNAAVAIEGVEVKAQVIRREADRFVVDVANMPSSIGKDGIELLEASPGVFIQDDKISINGKSGTKVYVNDRELKYSGDRLITYLRGLKNDEIQKIEVVPVSGADTDANSAGGIIKITLKRKRDDGIMGSVSFTTRQSDLIHQYVPSADIDYHTGKWTLSASGWYSSNLQKNSSAENTRYMQQVGTLRAKSDSEYDSNWGGAKIGAVFDINDRHSIGAEIEYYGGNSESPTESSTVMKREPFAEISNSSYRNKGDGNSVSATFNYIIKLDTLGSKFKLLADYTLDRSGNGTDYLTRKIAMSADEILSRRDSTYRDNSSTDYNVTSVSADYEKVFSKKITLKVGGKYTNNLMASDAVYSYKEGDAWHTRDEEYNYDINYTEHIGAVYAVASSKLGRWGLTAGLRGEYTYTTGRNTDTRRNYLSLFPNANVSFALKKDSSYSLIAQYARTIYRPNFWALNPERQQISDYSYQIGNPDLKPQFGNDISLTAVLKYKYSITLGVQLRTDEIQQVMNADAQNPDINYITFENLARTDLYYASANLPFQFTKWWSANFNLTGMCQGSRIRKSDPQKYYWMWFANASTTFTLPKKFFIDLSYWGSSDMHIANIAVTAYHNLNASIKKRLFEDRLTLSAGVRNIIPLDMSIIAYNKDFTRKVDLKQPWRRPMFTFSVSYNFNRGKKFNKKSIESGADASRMSKGGNNN